MIDGKVEENSFIQLECNVVSSNPSPNSFSWTVRGTVIPRTSNNKYTVENNGRLLKLHDISADDNGDYNCFGDNGLHGAECQHPYTLKLDVPTRNYGNLIIISSLN